MADNVPISAGSGTPIATDEIGGAHFQRVKLTWGADGVAADVETEQPVPVQLRASDGSDLSAGLPVTGTVVDLPVSGVWGITPDDVNTGTSGRHLLINCTVAGNVKVAFVDDSTLIFPVSVGLTILPWAVIQVFVSGTTATATYATLI